MTFTSSGVQSFAINLFGVIILLVWSVWLCSLFFVDRKEKRDLLRKIALITSIISVVVGSLVFSSVFLMKKTTTEETYKYISADVSVLNQVDGELMNEIVYIPIEKMQQTNTERFILNPNYIYKMEASDGSIVQMLVNESGQIFMDGTEDYNLTLFEDSTKFMDSMGGNALKITKTKYHDLNLFGITIKNNEYDLEIVDNIYFVNTESIEEGE